MQSVVEQYWSGVLRRLQAEVDSFNKLIKHQGERGRENELALARILEQLVPGRFGVGSGLLIDSSNQYSKQTDIVIFNQADEPALLAQTNQVLFPVENVRVAIEIKTSIVKREIVDAGEKAASIRALDDGGYATPVVALVAYESGLELETVAKHLYGLADRLDLVCVLELGLVAGRADLLDVTCDDEDGYIVAVTPLQATDDSGARIVGTRYPVPNKKSATEVAVGSALYPIQTLPSGEDYVAEPSRALLLFCEALLKALAAQGQGTSVMTRYVDATARDAIALPKQ
jgi:hypothetical protein